MNAFKYLPVVVTLALSPALHAADTFVSHYEPLHGTTVRSAEYATTDAKQQRAAPIALGFEALGQRFELNLEANDRIMAALPTDAAFAGISAYRGRLANNPDSWVRIVMFDGMPRGLVWDGETMFAIEAPGDSAVDIVEPVMYRLADLNILPGTMSCGVQSMSGNAEKVYATMQGEWDAAVSQAAGAISEISMSVVGDSLFTSAQGGDEAAAAAITARFNNIDGYFSEQVGVQLNVEYIETFDSASDPFDETLDSGSLLDQLSEYRLQTPAHNSRGLTHLYTGRNFDTSTVGVAWRGALCDRYFSAGLSEGRAGLITDSLIAAHEIGHNFGAEHDGQTGSSCADEAQTYIMAPSVNGSDQFSACSIAVMQEEAARARCVTALPAVDVGIKRSASASTVLLGASTVVEYEVSIEGTTSAADVVADFTLPDVLTLDSIATTAGNCSSGAGTVRCTLGDLPGLSQHTVTITSTPSTVGTGVLSASVTTADRDERPINNQDSYQLSVNPAVDLVVSEPATARVYVDSSTTMTATLENLAVIPATNVSIRVTLDSGLHADAASWSIGTCTITAQQIDCQAGNFAAQSSSSLSITATAMSTGTQGVTISLTSAEADADSSNNSASGTVSVITSQSESDDSETGGGTTNPLLVLLGALAVVLRRRAREREAR